MSEPVYRNKGASNYGRGGRAMSLTGEYAKRAAESFKTVEGRQLLSDVREALRLMDEAMREPSTAYRGQQIGKIMTALEMAADRYDLFGEKDRRRKPKRAAPGAEGDAK